MVQARGKSGWKMWDQNEFYSLSLKYCWLWYDMVRYMIWLSPKLFLLTSFYCLIYQITPRVQTVLSKKNGVGLWSGLTDRRVSYSLSVFFLFFCFVYLKISLKYITRNAQQHRDYRTARQRSLTLLFWGKRIILLIII